MSPAFAGQLQTPVGQAWANACAGATGLFGSLPNPGDGFTDPSCQTNVGISPSASAAVPNGTSNGFSFSSSANVSSTVGFIHTFATNAGTQASAFPGGSAYGGWNDLLSIPGPAGGTAIWVAPVWVHGDLTASGAGALTRMGVAAYANHSVLQGVPFQDFVNLNGGASGIRNSAIAFVWDFEAAFFGAIDDGFPPDLVGNYPVARIINFAIPIQFNTPFTLGIAMGGVAGETSEGGGVTSNMSTFDFSNTLAWAGPGYLIDQSSSHDTNFTISSQSGFNYNVSQVSQVPEPATTAVLGLALVAIAGLKRRRR